MSLWSRIANVFRGDGPTREIDEELQSHIAEALEHGRDPAEARRAFGSPLRHREQSRDVRLIAWLDSLRADAIFGWRQLMKRKVTSAAAILSLALGIGACTSAFRLVDALLLRPLPVADPQQLYALSLQASVDGKPATFDLWAYPAFQQMRDAVKDQAELLAISYPARMDLTYQPDQEIEKAYVQNVSGRMFPSFGLQPTLGRLLSESDDLKPGAHPYAVLSYDYWARRFRQDPKVIGRTFRLADSLYQIVGVGPKPFTGTSTGTVTDIFIPTMMHPGVTRNDWNWHQTLARVRPGVALEPLRQKLGAISAAILRERSKSFTGMPQAIMETYLHQKLLIEPAAAGASGLQQDYKSSLRILGVLVALVLLVACANVANLMTAQASARAREMALRVSIGAGRSRLVQLVLVESATMAILAATTGALMAWWSAPFVVARINPPDNPARLALPADWRVLSFGLALTVGVTLLFGLAPALRASSVKPSSALKGGEDPHSRRRLMRALIAAQVAFCFVVLFVAGLFAETFHRLSNRPIGFSSERLLTLDTIAAQPQAPVFWDQVAEHLRAVPGVEKVALCAFPLLNGNTWSTFISINGSPPSSDVYHVSVSPGWVDTMKIRFIAGGDFRATDRYPGAIVNETFVKKYFKDENPIGRKFETTFPRDSFRIVGVVQDSQYRNLRDPILPVFYEPFHRIGGNGVPWPEASGTFIVRTSSSNPLALASTLRREVSRARSEFRVSNIRTQQEINESHSVRERLLAMLGLFFATVALLLAGIGLYGVLDYSVLQRRREIGIRMALGAQAGHVARNVTLDVFSMVLLGAIGGLALGLGSARYIQTLLYQVKATELSALAPPALIILMAAMLAALPAVIRAVRIDPSIMLRTE
jgi:putative ABC transport system permease protein